MHLAVINVFADDYKDEFQGTWEVTVSGDKEEYLKFTIEIKEN
jgi:hypothetical protein